MDKRWVFKEQGRMEDIKHLQEVLNVDEHLANLLAQRHIENFDQAKAFFRPSLDDLHDPYLMKDMDKAIDRITQAINAKEKIMVYGDYDVDGTTAVSLVYSYLSDLYANKRLTFYVPDRYSEGYGISLKSIDYAKKEGYTLIIALDCGIKANDKIQYAKDRGIDFIIADHHRPGDTLPNAVAVLDPKRSDCEYPFKELSGCGVGFKLVQALASRKKKSADSVYCYLDLVVVSIAADIVPITGENRVLAHYGLKLINTDPRPGIEAILKYSGISKHELVPNEKGLYFSREIEISDLVFLVGPRINAAGRLENAADSVRLMIARKLDYSEKLASQINELNIERRSLDNQITEEALNMIETKTAQKANKCTVVYNQNWHKGVIGIVASRLTDTYYRPTIVLTQSNGLLTGSARSVKNYDIYDAIDACSDLLEHFGGHKYAAGLSLKVENFQSFLERFEKIVDQTIEESMLVPEIEVDTRILLSNINHKFYRILKQIAPFGPGNMAPIFQTDGVIDTGFARIVGKNHLKLEVIHPDISSMPIQAIAFQQGHHFEKISKGLPFNMVYHLEENEWQGKTNLQLNIKDIKF